MPPLSYRILAAALTSVVLVGLASPAAAQDVAAAKVLFNRGLGDMEAGRLEAACPAIGESFRLDPRPGTLFTLAECEAKRGRFATAVARYDDYLAMFARLPPDQQEKQLGREGLARAQKAALGPQVPELTVTLPPNAPKGVTVTRDDAPLAEAALGVALPIDPGEHVIRVKADGLSPVEMRITLAAGEKKQVVAALGPAIAAPPVEPPPAPPPVEPPPGPSPSNGGRRTAGFIVGGVGLGGVALGAVMGGLMLAKKGTVNDGCFAQKSGPSLCTADGKAAADSGKTFGLVSTIGFVAGLAGVGTGIVLVATAPRANKEAAWVRAEVLSAGTDGVRAGLRGAF